MLEFRIQSSNEAEARTAFEAAHRALAKQCETRMKIRKPPGEFVGNDQVDAGADNGREDDTEEAS